MRGCRGEPIAPSFVVSLCGSIDTREESPRYLDLGPIFGPILCIITAVQGLFLGILDWLQPRREIDLVPLPAGWSGVAKSEAES